MSELEFPPEVKERAISGRLGSDDHAVDEDEDHDDETHHVINNNNNKQSFSRSLYEMRHLHRNNHHNIHSDNHQDIYSDNHQDIHSDDHQDIHSDDHHMTSSDYEYAADDNYQDEQLEADTMATSVTRSRLSRLKSERLRLIEEVKNERKRYEKYLDKLTCQLFKVLLSQKKLKSDCSSLIERVSALETDNKRLKEALDEWSSEAKRMNSFHHYRPDIIQPITNLVKRPPTPLSNFIDFSSISDQPSSGQTFDGHSELCFFFHTHPPFLGQAIASLRRMELLPPTFQCGRCNGNTEEVEKSQIRRIQNDYYNVDSLNRCLAKDGYHSDEVKHDDVAWKGSTYSVLYDEVYGEVGLTGNTGERNCSKEHDCFCSANGWIKGMSRKTKFDHDQEAEKTETHYDQVADDFHHHHHRDLNYQTHDEDYFHDYQDHHQTLGNHVVREYKENPYQNLTNSNSDVRGSSSATYSTTVDGDQQSYMTNFSNTTLAPLSRSFYYTPGSYSSNHGSKMENSPTSRRLQSKIKDKSTRYSFNSEISGHVDFHCDDSLEEYQGQFKTISPDGRLPTTAMYRIKNANVARLVPIDRAIAEDFDEVNESNCDIGTRGEQSKIWNGDLYEVRDPQININETTECDSEFSCPWKLRLDQNYQETYSTTNEEDPNISEDECGDYAKLTKPIQKFNKRENEKKLPYSSGNFTKYDDNYEETTFLNSSKFVNAFGFLFSQNIQNVNSQFLKDLATEIDHFPSNSMSLSCLSLSPTSVDKDESLFESSSACLTDALGRSMDESSLSSFFVFESSPSQGFPINSSTVARDEDCPDYMALLNRNTTNAKATYFDSGKPIVNGFDKLSETSSRINMIRNSIKPKLNDKNQKNSNLKQFQNMETESTHKYENQIIPTQQFNSLSSINSQVAAAIRNQPQLTNQAKSSSHSATPVGHNSPSKSSTPKIHQTNLPSPVLKRANLFQNSKIPNSPKSTLTSANTSNSTTLTNNVTSTGNNASTIASNSQTITSNTSNLLHTSMSVPFRQQPNLNKQNTRNSLPPLNQMRTPTNKSTGATGKTGGFFRFNSKLLGSSIGAAKSTEFGQSVKTSPKMSPKTERSSLFKFSSPKLKRSSMTQQSSAEADNLITPSAEKRNGVCKTV